MRLLICLLLLSSLVSAQYVHNRPPGIEKGQVLGNTYRSEYFGFEMKLPDGWEPRYVGGSPDLSPLSKTETWGDLILFQAQPETPRSDEPRLISIGVSRAPVIRRFTLKDYLRNRLKTEQILDGPTDTRINGRYFATADFIPSGAYREHYARIMVTLTPEHIVTFVFVEATPEQLSSLARTAESVEGWLPWMRIRVAQGVMQKNVISQQPPIYPEEARKAGVTGAVVMQAVIGTDGNVKMLGLVSGHPLLAPAALEAVENWRYRPYILNGETVEVETQITINFTGR